jgi:hypothetical protein
MRVMSSGGYYAQEMTRPPLLTAMLAAIAILATPAAPALGGSSDMVATSTYIQADYALLHAASSRLATSEASLRDLHRQIKTTCPRAAAGSPQNTDAEQLSNELVGAMTVAAIRPDASAVAAFFHAVGHLHWRNGTLTRRVRSYASRLRILSLLPAPNVCADVKTWAASRYEMLPASAVQFDSRYYKVEVAVGETPVALLAPSELPPERPLLVHARQFERQLTEAEAKAVYTWGDIVNELDLNP